MQDERQRQMEHHREMSKLRSDTLDLFVDKRCANTCPFTWDNRGD